MKATQIIPSVQILLSIGATVVYALNKDLGRVIYWASSAALVFAVTFLFGK